MEVFVRIDHLNLKVRNKTILDDLSWQIIKGEQWLLTGPSGSGKTILGKALAKVSALTASVLFVQQWSPFKDKQGSSNLYFQQRFNSADSENTISAWEDIIDYARKLHKSIRKAQDLLNRFDLWERKDAPIIQLSSGEHKKLQLIKALIYSPQLLILDNPYTGLDVQTRITLNQQLELACAAGMHLVIISNDDVVPNVINRYASIVEGKIVTSTQHMEGIGEESLSELQLPGFLQDTPAFTNENIVQLDQVSITYGDKQVLKSLSWKFNKGEKWLLKGYNGSGKSTLISLVTGDNPQAYANEIYLFGRKRGTGESIWDIKKHIGFISPELQWFFEPSSTIFETIGSGFFDTIGLFRNLSLQQTEKINELLQLFGLEAEAESLLTQAPIGKQRLALLARAIIKNPPLLILDEPCQGLDEAQTSMFNNLVDLLCTPARSLIYVSHFENRLPRFLTHELHLHQGRAVSIKPITEQEIKA